MWRKPLVVGSLGLVSPGRVSCLSPAHRGAENGSPGQDTAWISQNITLPGAGETFGSNADGAHLESSSFVVVFSSLVLHFIFPTSCGISIKLQQKIRNIAFFTCIFNLLNPRGNFLN